ncbi:S-adenosyl-L-methionine-dependent methyltransferase [Lipomyces tetrasporus]|uniref:S-adenosyl-L-methionine-dependent methyltransferase n=1 Tax=Lipomyces tetrasporus TaxID=54092 RepID=A0AAD7QYM7_9ASCO|nr:S-adenosyl-L-methionine-dependent methyltransferase [Lipomyces tetrasporus]KAJ8103850.1 S-adenosyl-L-methionine-dependent methyltransferase [Lipomyces tetrasporus]
MASIVPSLRSTLARLAGQSLVLTRMSSTSASSGTEVHPTSLNSFNTNHALYDKYRPTHYQPAVDSLVSHLNLPSKAKVIDLASGTGKFTALLNKFNFDLSAVEISDGMLETFRSNFPGIPAYKGSSYDIPCPDSSLDAIFIAQAFHWFADISALREFRRVLKPGTGALALIWNFEPEIEHNSPWQRKVAELCWAFDVHLPQFRRMNWQNVFDMNEAAELFETPLKVEKKYWSYKTPPEAVYPLWETKSYITALDNVERAQLKENVEQIVAQEAKDYLDENGMLDIKMGVYYTWTVSRG